MNLEHWKRHLNAHEPYAGCNQKDIDELIKLLPKGYAVLCVGAGDGYEIKKLRDEKRDAIGISRNLDEVKKACSMGLPMLLADMHDLPFKDEAFDCVFCKDVWEHSVAPYISLAEMARVLKESGYILIRLPDVRWIECIYHYSVLTKRQVKEMFAKCKLEFHEICPGNYIGRKNKGLKYGGYI